MRIPVNDPRLGVIINLFSDYTILGNIKGKRLLFRLFQRLFNDIVSKLNLILFNQTLSHLNTCCQQEGVRHGTAYSYKISYNNKTLQNVNLIRNFRPADYRHEWSFGVLNYLSY